MISGITLPTASVVIANEKNIRHMSQRIRRAFRATLGSVPVTTNPPPDSKPYGERIANVCING